MHSGKVKKIPDRSRLCAINKDPVFAFSLIAPFNTHEAVWGKARQNNNFGAYCTFCGDISPG